MSNRLSVAQVLSIAEIAAPGAVLVRPDLLKGAVEAPFFEAFGISPFPTVVARATKLAEGISRVQAFADGNKRTAWIAMTTYLNLNDHEMTDSEAEFNGAWMSSLMCDPTEHLDCAMSGHALDPPARTVCQDERFRLGTIWLNDRVVLKP